VPGTPPTEPTPPPLSPQVTGQAALEARWKRCVQYTGEGLGELLGHYFVEEVFAGASRAEAQDMIQTIEAAFEQVNGGGGCKRRRGVLVFVRARGRVRSRT